MVMVVVVVPVLVRAVVIHDRDNDSAVITVIGDRGRDGGVVAVGNSGIVGTVAQRA